MPGLVLTDLTTRVGHATGDRRPFTLGPLSLAVAPGECVVITGPVGAGKSTLIECMLGLRPVAGAVTLDGERLDTLPIERRRLGWVPQDGALLASRTVRQQITQATRFPSRRRPPASRKDAPAVAASLLDDWSLSSLAERRPAELSGGQRQQVALVRAIASRPAALLMDEPFSAQDPETRVRLRGRIRAWAASESIPLLHITHDEAEAEAIADRRVVLVDGQIAKA